MQLDKNIVFFLILEPNKIAAILRCILSGEYIILYNGKANNLNWLLTSPKKKKNKQHIKIPQQQQETIDKDKNLSGDLYLYLFLFKRYGKHFFFVVPILNLFEENESNLIVACNCCLIRTHTHLSTYSRELAFTLILYYMYCD